MALITAGGAVVRQPPLRRWTESSDPPPHRRQPGIDVILSALSHWQWNDL